MEGISMIFGRVNSCKIALTFNGAFTRLKEHFL